MSPSSSSKGKSSGLNQHYEEKVRPCIDLVDSLRSLGVEKDLNLPAIAVIGDQSSGKSSVLEALSGVALPRGTGNTNTIQYYTADWKHLFALSLGLNIKISFRTKKCYSNHCI